MDLVLVRHAIAEERAPWAATGGRDEDRPLTAHGRSRMKRNAAGLAVAAPGIDLLVTSPLARAAQTADVLARVFRDAKRVTLPSLASGGSRDETLAWLAGRREKRIALVGHEPDLGALAAYLLDGDDAGALPMRKGGACLLRFAGRPEAAAAHLRWFLPPSLLRRLRR